MTTAPETATSQPSSATDSEVRAVMKVCREFYSSPVAAGPQFARAVIDAVHSAR